MNSRSDIADLAVLLKDFEVTFVNETTIKYKGVVYDQDELYANLISTGQKAMVQLAEFTKGFQAQGLRMQEMMARLEQAVALLKAIHKGQISNVNEEIENFLNLKSNIVNFALEGPIAPQENKE